MHMLPMVVEFLKRYPDILVRLMLTDRVTNFNEDRVDVALRIGNLPDSSLIATRLGSVRRVTYASPDYLEAHAPPPLRPEDLGSHVRITFEGLTSPQVWRFGAGKLEMAVAVKSRLVVNTAEAAIDAAVAGLGITRVLSYQVFNDVLAGKLQVILDAFEPEPWPVNLVYPDRGLLPLKTRAFLDFATAQLHKALREL